MKRHAFSLVELIFVIVLMGVLTGIGFYMSRPDPTRADAQYALLKLKEARYRAIGYDDYNESNCVTLTREALSLNKVPRHEIKSDEVSIKKLSDGNDYASELEDRTICFDSLGRPHKEKNIDLSSLVHEDLNITFEKSAKSTSVTLFSGTGYAIIPCNN